MKIKSFETLHADATGQGFQSVSFLKIETDTHIVGWSEFVGFELNKRMGLDALIQSMMKGLIGTDPRKIEKIYSDLITGIRQSQGGLNHQAMGAIQNCLVDITAKDLGIPVYSLFGGPIRTQIPLYWSHFGSNRLPPYSKIVDEPSIMSQKDYTDHAIEVREKGFRALKTKIVYFDEEGGKSFYPAYGVHPGGPELNLEPKMLNYIVDQMSALRDAVGEEFDLILDLNSNFKANGVIRISQALGELNLRWLEIDLFDPLVMSEIRKKSPTTIGGSEFICTAKNYKHFFLNNSIDVPLVDVAWNGFSEALKIASLADVFDLNVSPHNYTSHLCTMMHGHFSAVIPNLQLMEIDIDEVPWMSEFFTEPLVIKNGELVLSDKPGWGIDVNEDAVRARPPRVKIEN